MQKADGTTGGAYRDLGPTPKHEYAKVGHVRETIRQGEDRPRPLSAAQALLAEIGREEARVDELAMKHWKERGYISGMEARPSVLLYEEENLVTYHDEEDRANFEDYWLTPDPDRAEQTGWFPIGSLSPRDEEDLADIEHLMGASNGSAYCSRHPLEQTTGERGEGLTGVTGDYFDARAAILRRGDYGVVHRIPKSVGDEGSEEG